MTRFLLVFCLISPTFLNLTVCEDQNDCSYIEIAANNEGRSCVNKPCIPNNKDCKGKRTCVCDGACGYRCISTRSSKLCAELDAPENGSVVLYQTDDLSFGSKASYKCKPGYLPSASVERTCLGDKEWSNEEPPVCLPQDLVCPVDANATCLNSCSSRRDCSRGFGCLCDETCGMSCLEVYVPQFCPRLEPAPGTVLLSIKPRGSMFSSVATLGCAKHFEVESGSVAITCQLDGNWSATPLRCRPQPTCDTPPNIDRIEHNARGKVLHPGDTIKYNCRAGYSYYGNGQTSTCEENLSWTPVDFQCYPISCGDPGYLENGWREGFVFTFQSSITFHCNDGYEMRGFPYRTCLSNQDWSSFMPNCVAIRCPNLYSPDHGTMQGSEFTYDAQVYFRCDTGYKHEGSDMRQCQSDKTWSGIEPTCRFYRCPTPEAPQHGSMIAPRFGLNAIIRFSCNPGYTMEGSRLSRCTAEETWSEPVPFCQAGCTVPNRPENGYYDSWSVSAGDSVQHGQEMQVNCNRNYILNSNRPYMCDNGQWSFDAECIATPCSKRDELLNTNITYTPALANDSLTIPHDTTFTYTCIYGYQQESVASTSIWTCNFGRWDGGDIPKCKPKSCPVEDLLNGKVSYYIDLQRFKNADGPHHGVLRSFICGDSFTLVEASSDSASMCNDGQWTTPLPTCEPESCSALRITDGTVEYSNTDMGHETTARLTCSRGRKPSVGNGDLQCHAGHWVPDGVACVNNDAVINVAFGKRAWQSTGSREQLVEEAKRAVDGDRNMDKIHGSCFAPRRIRSSTAKFWEVDLEATYMIEHVDIYMSESNANVSKQVTVQIGPAEFFKDCGSAAIATEDGQPIRINCTPANLYGQVIRIPLNWASRMTLCEVEVFATGPLPTCPIPNIDNMKITMEGQEDQLPFNMLIVSGERIQYSCNSGYEILGAPWNQCNKGIWKNATPKCKPVACNVKNPVNGRLNYQVTDISHGTELDYTCNQSYEKKIPHVVCKLGVLTPGKPSCIPKSCQLDSSTLSNVLINDIVPPLDSDGRIVMSHNTLLNFSCKQGFYIANSVTWNRCWYGDLQNPNQLPSCIITRCLDPTYPANGNYEITEGTFFVHGTIIRYYCNRGYVLEDPNTEFSTCDNGGWSQDGLRYPYCLWRPEQEAECPTPSVQNANIFYNDQNIATVNHKTTFSHNDQISIKCLKSYNVNGAATLMSTCLNGLWSPALVSCEHNWYASCPRPDNIDNVAQYIDSKTKLDDARLHFDFKHTVVLESRCRDVLTKKLMTESIRRCYRGQWVGPTPRCEATGAWFVLHDRWSTIKQYFANGTLLIYPGVGKFSIECRLTYGHPEFVYHHRQSSSRSGNVRYFGVPLANHSGIYLCRQLGGPSVSHTLHIIVAAVSCPEDEVQPPENGRREGDDFRIGGVVSFKCKEGYDLVGDQSFKCFLGKWLGRVPKCQAHDCPEIQPDDPNLTLITQGTSSGSRVAFTCSVGYTLVGEDILDCEAGNWSHSIPHCEVVAISSDTAPVLNCSCEVWEACVMDIQSRKPVCKCIHPQNCQRPNSPDEVPYCGSDGQTYPSICKMKALACFLNRNITVFGRGECPENMTLEVDDNDYLSSSEYDYSSLYIEPTQDETTLVPNEGLMTTASVSPTGTHSTESNRPVLHCDRCTLTDIRRACQDFPYIFVGQPTKRLGGSTNLAYSVKVILPYKGLSGNMTGTNITMSVPNFDEVNSCECPGLIITREYLFILESSIHDNFQVTNSSVVEFWAEKSLEFHSYSVCHNYDQAEEVQEEERGPA